MADTSAQRLLDDVLGFARDFAGARVSINVKTNLGPELAVGEATLGPSSSNSGSGAPGGFAGLLGLKAAVILRDANGRAVASFGDPPATDVARVAILGALALVLLFVIVRGLRR